MKNRVAIGYQIGIQKYLVALQESFQRLTNESSSTAGKGGDMKQEVILDYKKTLKSLKSSATLNASTRSMETIASSSMEQSFQRRATTRW